MNTNKQQVTKDGSRWRYLLCGSFFKLRGVLMVPLILVMLFVTGPAHAHHLLDVTTGLLMFIAGFALRIRSQQYLQYRLRTAPGLAVAGPYAYVRNPVYVANILMFAGLCILCGLYWLVPLAIGWAFFVYQLSIRFEESRLTKRFGNSYLEYREKVPRWVSFRGHSSSSQRDRASLWSAIKAEWHNPFLLLVPLAREVLHQQSHQASPRIARALAFADSHRLLLVGFLLILIIALAIGRLIYLRRRTAQIR